MNYIGNWPYVFKNIIKNVVNKMIEQYNFGSITISGKQYTADLKIIAGQVVSGWWRKSGHLVDLDDIADIIRAKPENLVIGTGNPGLMKVSVALKQHLESCGINLIEQPTATAVKTFNQLLAAGKNPAAGFHLTC